MSFPVPPWRTLLALTLAFSSSAFAQHFPSTENLTTRLRTLVERREAKGLVLGVLEADGTRRIAAYGEAGAGARPLGPLSVFEIGSATKAFTGILLAEMIGKGEAALADPVSNYLPAGIVVPSRAGRQITLLDLITHQAGLPRRPTNYTPPDPANPYAHYTVEMLYELLKTFELPHEIGAQFDYSNVGVGLLGHALSRRAGGSYEEVLRQRVLAPLGLRMTAATLTPEMSAWMTQGHNAQGEVVSHWDATDALAAAGALKSNAEDMLTFLAANLASPTSALHGAIRQSHVKQKEINARQSYGLGWYIVKRGERTIVGHTGGTGGYSSFVGFDPEKKVALVILRNSGGSDQGALLSQALDLLAPPPPEAVVPLEILQSYVGNYALRPDVVLLITLEEGRLFAQVGSSKLRLFAESETRFSVGRSDAPTKITFERNEHGAITQATRHRNGIAEIAPKIP